MSAERPAVAPEPGARRDLGGFLGAEAGLLKSGASFDRSDSVPSQYRLAPVAIRPFTGCLRSKFVHPSDLVCVVSPIAQPTAGEQHFDQECEEGAHCENQSQTKGHE